MEAICGTPQPHHLTTVPSDGRGTREPNATVNGARPAAYVGLEVKREVVGLEWDTESAPASDARAKQDYPLALFRAGLCWAWSPHSPPAQCGQCLGARSAP